MRQKRLLILYSHKDTRWADRLAETLNHFISDGSVQRYSDSGSDVIEELERVLAAAAAVLLLASPAYLTSPFAREGRVWGLLDRAMARGLKVSWIPVRSCDYRTSKLFEIQALSDPARPLELLTAPRRDALLVDIANATISMIREPRVEADGLGRPIIIFQVHGGKNDEYVATFLKAELGKLGLDSLIESTPSSVGMLRRLVAEIEHAQAVIPLISENSAVSETFGSVIETAHETASQRRGYPRILPVRVQFEGLLEGSAAIAGAYLQYYWRSDADAEQLLKGLVEGIRRTPEEAPPVRSVGGAMQPSDPFYIQREADSIFESALLAQEGTILIKGARQMGKTSLLARVLQHARQNSRVAFTDLQIFNTAQLGSLEQFYYGLADRLLADLNIDADLETEWQSQRAPNVNFDLLMRHVIMPAGPLVWAMDETDRILGMEWAGEFFGLIRSWHNERSLSRNDGLPRLTIVISYATEAHLFIRDLNQSPFNVGVQVQLRDFNLDEFLQLNSRHGSPLDPQEVEEVYGMIGGQPYLVRRALADLAGHRYGFREWMELADRDDGPFGDHLRRILVVLAHSPELESAVRDVLTGKSEIGTTQLYRLTAAGILTGTTTARPRSQLYERYLRRHLLESRLPAGRTKGT
jgi:hypothetical protein